MGLLSELKPKVVVSFLVPNSQHSRMVTFSATEYKWGMIKLSGSMFACCNRKSACSQDRHLFLFHALRSGGERPRPLLQDGRQWYSQLMGVPDSRLEEGTLPKNSSDLVLISCWQESNPWPHSTTHGRQPHAR